MTDSQMDMEQKNIEYPKIYAPNYEPKIQDQVQAYSNDKRIMAKNLVFDPTGFDDKPNSRKSQVLNCSKCKSLVWSEIKYERGCGTHRCSMILFVTTIVLACVPYCSNTCRDAVHYCPKCGQKIGTIKY